MPNTNPYESPNMGMDVAPVASDRTFTLRGCLTVADARAAHRLATRGFWPRVILANAILAVFSIGLAAVAVSSRPSAPQASNVMLLFACGVPGLFMLRYVRGHIRLRQLAQRQYGVFALTQSTFSTDRITATSENAKSEYEWPLFSGFRANDSIALLFFANSKQDMIVARGKLQPPDDWPALLRLLESKLPRA